MRHGCSSLSAGLSFIQASGRRRDMKQSSPCAEPWSLSRWPAAGPVRWMCADARVQILCCSLTDPLVVLPVGPAGLKECLPRCSESWLSGVTAELTVGVRPLT